MSPLERKRMQFLGSPMVCWYLKWSNHMEATGCWRVVACLNNCFFVCFRFFGCCCCCCCGCCCCCCCLYCFDAPVSHLLFASCCPLRPAIFWLSEQRAHDRSMIFKVKEYLGPFPHTISSRPPSHGSQKPSMVVAFWFPEMGPRKFQGNLGWWNIIPFGQMDGNSTFVKAWSFLDRKCTM